MSAKSRPDRRDIGDRMKIARLETELTKLREARDRFVAAFDERFKPTGIEDEYRALKETT